MKVIEKTSATYAYQCEICDTEFDSEELALNCEKRHCKVTGFTEKLYKDSNSKYPDTVKCRMTDNSIQSYMLSYNTPTSITQNVTNNTGSCDIALVSAYKVTVKKEYTDNGETKSETITGVNVELKDGRLYVNVPDEIYVSSDMNICVKVMDANGNEVTKDSKDSPFKDITIVAEVTQTVPNKCIE